MEASTNIKKDVRVIIKKKNNPGNQRQRRGKGNENMRESGGQKKIQGMGFYFGMNNNPRFRQMMQEHGGGWGSSNNNQGVFNNNFNDFEENDYFAIYNDVWGNTFGGNDWIQQQQRRKKQNQLTFEPGQVQQIQPQNIQEEQIIYIQPDVAQKKLQELRRQGKQFYDQNFPPNQQSLTGRYGHLQDWQPIKWKKLSAKMKNAKIFIDKANPRDIKQGFLGDCYFLAGLAALAQNPHRIYDLFLLTQKNQVNYYSVKMIYRGKWRTINLDEHIPYVFSIPAFSKSDKQQMWVMLLQKAWAKLYGSYKHIQAGFAEQPLHDLTGAPIKHLFLTKKFQQNWEYLFEGSKLNYAMVASSNPGSDTQQSACGIVQGHAYTFLNATYLQTQDRRERIVRLRNPWGKGQFRGKWSDSDEDWNKIPELEKKRISFDKNQDDGIFFMRYEDFVREFKSMTIAQINDNASYVYESCVDKNCQGVFFTIKISKPGSYSFQVDKTPQRAYFGDQQYNFRYPAAQISLGKISQNQTQKFRGLISKRRTLFQAHDLVPGTYVAEVKVQYDRNYEKDYQVVLAVYSQYVCSIRLSTNQEAIKFSGNPNIRWSGQRILLNQSQHMGRTNKSMNIPKMKAPLNNEVKPNITITPQKKQPQKLFQSFSPKKNQKKTKQVKNNHQNASKQTVKDNNNSLSKMSLFSSRQKNNSFNKSLVQKVPGKGKRIRTIQVHTSKITVTNQKVNGQTVIKRQQTETKKQILNTHSDGKKTKELQKKVEAEQSQFMGQTLKLQENYVETIQTAYQKPDGEIMRKVEKKQGQIETVEESDDIQDRLFSQLIQEGEKEQQEVQQVKKTDASFQLDNQSQLLGEQEKRRILQEMQKKIFKGKDKLHVKIQIDDGQLDG